MPVFNGARFLRETLVGIFAQTLRDFELLAIDDGSTDNTLAILQEFAADPRLRILSLGHQGICHALNCGMQHARAELIARIDADDVMLPERLERQVAFLRNNPKLGGIGSFYYIIDEAGEVRGRKQIPLCTLESVREQLDAAGELIYPHPTIMFRKEKVLSLGGYRSDYEKCEDVDLFLRMFEAGCPILVQPEYLTRFRYHSSSVTANSVRRQFHLKALIFGNYRRRKAGQPEISEQQYLNQLNSQGILRQAQTEARIQSALQMRKVDVARLRGRTVRANILLMTAALLNPAAIFRKVRRVMRKRPSIG